ncbi:Uncharacterised protein [Klebsiella pneumoniae]|uniref:Uncharacterized protein n=1 Tax=Klebsiella pneumoniae TaxID=573 RepID=A0A378AHA6_KLEPN|nr:Uncharacterised protein [Klebsiella pneumoniae]
MRHHHGIALAQQALDFFAVKLLFVDGQRLRFSRERINRRFRIKHYAHHAISFYWLNSITVSMACRRLNTVMVFYMLNKIADYELKVVMNFVHQTLFRDDAAHLPERPVRILCRHGKRSVTVGK